MKIIKYILIILFISCLPGCEIFQPYHDHFSLEIYKTKKDYTNNAFVQLSEDKTTIGGTPFKLGQENNNLNHYPIKLKKGYLFFGTLGPNTAYLSISIAEWDSLIEINQKLSDDSIYKLIIDDDPFLEYYFRKDGNEFWNPDLTPPFDTARLNKLIMENKLEKYFERLK